MRIDGVDVAALDDLARAATVSAVLQDVRLFSGSVADNIALARPQATRAEVMAAAQTAGCHDFITALPEGYDTRIGEQGADCPAGSASRSPLPGPFSRTPRCSCSTR